MQTRKSAKKCNHGEISVILTPDAKATPMSFVIRKVEKRQKEEVRSTLFLTFAGSFRA